MDIRNFFGKPGKKSAAPAASSKPAPKKKPAAGRRKPAAAAAAPTSSRGGNDNGGEESKKKKKTKAASKKEESGSDTEMEDDDVREVAAAVATESKAKRGKKRAIDDSSSSSDDDDDDDHNDDNGNDDTDDEVERALAEAKRKRRAAAASAASPGSAKKPAKKSPAAGARPVRRKAAEKVAAFESIDSGSDDEDEEPARPARKRAAKKAAAFETSGDDDEESEEGPKRRASPRRASPRKRAASPAAKKAAAKSERKIVVVDSDGEDEDTKNEDDDFEPAADDNDGDDDDDDVEYADSDSEVEIIVRKSKKRKASTAAAAVSERASPKKRASAGSATPKKKPPAGPTSPERKSPARAASPKRKPPARAGKASPAKRVEPTKPPKYHPPSSELTTRIPYLADNSKVALPEAPPLPTLPENNPNFDLDSLTPHCLEGLTFVFSGILSTNEQKTKETNAEVMEASPNKGDYYKNRGLDVSDSNCELSRDSASDIVKSLGGRVTAGSVSGKTDYLVVGSILEDGREVEEGSKYRKCMEMWEAWGEKWRGEYDDDDDNDDEGGQSSGKKKAMTKAQKKDQDPNSLVEIVRGIYEFYGLVACMSEWKKGTMSPEDRAELEARQQPVKAEPTSAVKSEPTSVKIEAIKAEFAAAASSTPSASKASPANPYSASSAASGVSVKSEISNPYAKKSPANPYAKKSPGSAVSNPYAKKSPNSAVANPYARAATANPYAKKSSPSNPYAGASSAQVKSEPTTKSGPTKSNNKELGPNSLWADRYAPSHSGEILGNSDSVNKLKRWLNGWEGTFNNPKRAAKGLSGPGGPWKAALLSGPPGIGKTTTATLVAQESGRDVLELNASDARSKKALTQALGDVTGSQVLSFGNMGGGSSKKKSAVQRRCVIMDEVDGMGAGDRSGMSELIQMIKKSKVPIICICNDRSSQKMKSLVQYCMDLRYRRPTKMVIARRAVEIGRLEGMQVEINAAEAMAESCGNDIRQLLNSLQMWSCKKKASGKGSAMMTYRDLKERQGEINKDEILRVSMFDACRSIVEGSRNLAGADAKAVTASLLKRTDAYFVDYMLMGLMVHQNYLKVSMGQYNSAKIKGDEDDELAALESIHEATHAMSDFGMCEESLRGGDQNWSLLPLCSVLAVKVGHHAGGPTGGILPGYPEFAGWLGKNSSRNKKIRLLQELRRHMNYKVSADAGELRMNYLPIMREQFQQLLFDKEGARVTEAIELMDEYGLDRDDVFENLDEFTFNSKELKVKKFGEMDSKSKSVFTRAYNSMSHKAQALVAEQGAEKTGKRKAGGNGASEMGGGELDVVDDDKATAAESDNEDEEDLEALKKKFLKKGRGGKKAAAKGKGKGATSSKPKGIVKRGKK